MPWFYVDDGFSDSKPVLNMPGRYRLAACGLWVLAGSWSAKEELDGFVPESKLQQLGARQSIVDVLTDIGPMSAPLWVKVSGGIQFKSWEKWQKTRAELAEKRREAAERQRKTRARKSKGRNAVASDEAESSQRDSPATDGVTDDECHTDVTRDPYARAHRPDPTRPDPTQAISGYLPESATEPNARDSVAATPGADLVRELIPPTIPDSERTMLRIKASALLRSGSTRDDVAEGLRLYLAKPHLGAGALPALVSEAVRARAAPNGRPAHKIRAYAELAAEVRAKEQAQLESTNRRKTLE